MTLAVDGDDADRVGGEFGQSGQLDVLLAVHQNAVNLAGSTRNTANGDDMVQLIYTVQMD